MDLDDLRALLSVIDHGSTQAAAAATRTSRTTLRRRLEALEALVGVPLLVRGSSGAVPTPAGLALAEGGRGLVEGAAALLSAVRDSEYGPEGLVRVLAPVGMPSHLVGLLLQIAREKLPRLEFRLALSEDPLSVLRDDVDMVLHFGAPPARGPWISTVLADAPERLVANPELLAERGAPRTLEDLAQLPLLSWVRPGEDERAWPLRDGGSLPVRPILCSADVHLLRCLAAAGHGVALVPDGGLPEGPDVPGTLVAVLPELVGRPCALRALMPESMLRLPKGRALVDLLKDFMRGLAAAGLLAESGHPMA